MGLAERARSRKVRQMNSLTIPGGLLVAIEGIDGAGKSTLARSLAQALAEVGAAVSMGKEPTTGPYGMQLRASAATGRLSADEEVDLLLLDRRQHVDEMIRPALDRGEIVILDRYFPSMVAYQGAAGVPIDDLVLANEFAPKPDLLLLLDLDPSQGLQRIRDRGDKPNHFETPENLQRCREIFLGMAGAVRIDASHSADDVLIDAHAATLRAIAGRIATVHGPTVSAVEKLQSFLPALS